MKTITAILIATMLAGCAVAPANENYSIIDPAGVDMNRYRADYDDCARLANQTDVADRAAGSAVAGGIFGAIIGGLLCGRNCAGQMAGVGAISAASGGASGGVREQQRALRACLAGRNYRVIR